MSAPPTAEWYLEVGGKKTGPYSTSLVLEFVRSGQLLPQHRVTAAHLGDQWISVEQLAYQVQSAAGGAEFHPPPKPHALEKSHSYSPPVEGVPRTSDPMLGLFDALQAAKDRKPKTHASGPAPVIQEESIFGSIPVVGWIGIGGVAVVGMIAWGFMSAVKQQETRKPTHPIAQRENSRGAAASPVSASARAAPGNRAPAAATKILPPGQRPVTNSGANPGGGPAAAAAARNAAQPVQLSRPIAPSKYPHGRVGQPANGGKLSAPVVRTPAGSDQPSQVDPRDLEYERQRQREESEREKERAMYDGGRDPDSAGNGEKPHLEPAPKDNAPPQNSAGSGEEPGDRGASDSPID